MIPYIMGTGGALPRRAIDNAHLAQTLDTSDEWIRTRTGIKQRYVVEEDEGSISLATEAAKQACEASDISPDTLDLMIVATMTPEGFMPSAACRLQKALGVQCMAFDVNAACSGFMYALSVARHFLMAKSASRVCVVGVDVMSRVLDWQDRNTCVLFGDGAGAVILGMRDTQEGVGAVHCGADGAHADLLTGQMDAQHRPVVAMKGREVFKLAVRQLTQLVDKTLSEAGMTAEQLDWLVPHQANQRIIQSVAEHLSFPMSRVILTLQDQANTSAATIPLALDTAIRDGRIQRGHRLLLESFGAGLTWGASLIVY